MCDAGTCKHQLAGIILVECIFMGRGANLDRSGIQREVIQISLQGLLGNGLCVM